MDCPNGDSKCQVLLQENTGMLHFNTLAIKGLLAMDLTAEKIHNKVPSLLFKGQAFINGRYVDAKSGKTFDSINPATGKILTKVAACDQEDVEIAVKSARQAFNAGVWSQRAPSERKTILLKFADLIEQHQFDLALMETLDTGKPISDSATIDLPGTINCIRWYAEIIDKIYGQVAPTAPNIIATITREPLGVVGAVTPWNYPIYLACSRIAPALVCGNSIIIKPAEQSSLTAIYIAELATEAGVPPGVLNVIPGIGEIAGRALGMHPDVDGISFTGSTEVGKLFLRYSSESNMKRINLECGGKSPNIIMADYQDLDRAAAVSAGEVFLNQGEICCAPTRLLVQHEIKDKFLEKLILAGKKFHPADPLDPATRMGAIIDETQTKQIISYIESGKDAGAKLVLGGKQVHQHTGGYFIEPTIFDNVQNSMKIAREEIFGPVLSIIPFKTMEEAIQIANDTHYGLAAAVWTQDINRAHKIAKAIRAGVVSVNCVSGGDVTTPFGGYKQSGIGRESGLDALHHYSEVKTTWIELS